MGEEEIRSACGGWSSLVQQPVSAASTGPRNVCRILVWPLCLKLVGFHTGKVSGGGANKSGRKAPPTETLVTLQHSNRAQVIPVK